MKKYILSALVVGAATMFTACDDMLDTDPRVTDATQATFPGKIADVEALNTATYSIMNTMGGGDADNQNPFYWWEVMSDNCYGSGGLQDNKVKSLHHLVEMSTNQYEQPFILLYGGINRANNQIETIDNVDWKGNEAKRNQLLGEGYFMRGLYTLWLTQLYGDIPLITSTTITPEMEEEVSAEEKIYPQILSDFTSGIKLMSAEKNSGHANKFVAEAFAARAYMFWAGFYKNVKELATDNSTSMQLIKQEGCDGNIIDKETIKMYLVDVITAGGYKLCEDYRSLWQYSNSYLWDEAHDGTGHAYDFIADMKRENCFDQPGMGNGNTEEIFQIQFMNASRWAINGSTDNGGTYSTSRMYCNYLSVFWALRVNGTNGDRDHTYPFTQGWGQGTPSTNIWDDWTLAEAGLAPEYAQTDKRKLATLICGIPDSPQKEIDYDFVKDCCEASGLGVKKYNGVTLDACTGDTPWWNYAGGDSFKGTLENPMQGEHFEDFYLMRYADVLLMMTEISGDPQYMNLVQERAGLRPTGYSLQNVQNERRWEFAFEGLRFNDMRRWTGKGTKDGYATKALQAQAGKQMYCNGKNKQSMKHMTCSWKERYEATDGFLAKPQSQITLMEGKLKQNPGWDAADPKTQYVTLY